MLATSPSSARSRARRVNGGTALSAHVCVTVDAVASTGYCHLDQSTSIPRSGIEAYAAGPSMAPTSRRDLENAALCCRRVVAATSVCGTRSGRHWWVSSGRVIDWEPHRARRGALHGGARYHSLARRRALTRALASSLRHSRWSCRSCGSAALRLTASRRLVSPVTGEGALHCH